MTQREKVLNVLEEANGGWVNGRHFAHGMGLTQFHTRIHELQKQGYDIKASDFKDEYGFKSYRLISKPYKFIEVEEAGQVVKQGVLI